jgi:ABC-type uncharacterized transport system YnjBCD substrate-binding protein
VLDQPNDRFTKRLDTRITQVEENIRDLNKKLKDLQSECINPSVTVKMLLLASQHLDTLTKSRKVMLDIIASRLPNHSKGDQQTSVPP